MAEEEKKPVLLDRTARPTRGKRMTKLLDQEELEQDEQFWNQDALKEEENDDNYEEEGEAADVYDSDFNESEPDADEEAANVVEERLPMKKRLSYPGKQLRKPTKTKTKTKTKNKTKNKKEEEENEEEIEEKSKDEKAEIETEKSTRKSTRTAVIVRQAEREAIQAELQASFKPIKRKKQGEEKRMTQEEMLLEAAETEIMNLRHLERVLAREEEVKKKAVIHKSTYSGPEIRYYSKDGNSHLEFLKGASFGSELSIEPVSYPEKSTCVVTGLPAKYKDPKTGLPYATLEAFKIIRARLEKEESERIKKPKDLQMGELFESLSVNGFSSKNKRTGLKSDNNPQPVMR